MDPGQLIAGRSRETEIRRDADGHWWNGDDRITHPNLVRAFNAWIDRAEDGRYCLKNDINWAYVEIAGAPIFVLSARVHPDRIELVLSDGREERLDPRSLRQSADGVLYCDVRKGTMTARFDRSAMQDLESALVEDKDSGQAALIVGDMRVIPPTVDAPLDWKS